MKKNEILDQSFDFALKIIELAKFLKNKKEYVISNQNIKKWNFCRRQCDGSAGSAIHKRFYRKALNCFKGKSGNELLVKIAR